MRARAGKTKVEPADPTVLPVCRPWSLAGHPSCSECLVRDSAGSMNHAPPKRRASTDATYATRVARVGSHGARAQTPAGKSRLSQALHGAVVGAAPFPRHPILPPRPSRPREVRGKTNCGLHYHHQREARLTCKDRVSGDTWGESGSSSLRPSAVWEYPDSLGINWGRG